MKLFRDLAETKSFTLVAERNGLSQSAVSQQLQFMERRFKSRFAERGGKTFRLTPEGKILRDHARKIVQIYDTFKSKWEEMAQITSTTVRVATTPYIGLYSLPPCLQQFQAQHPQASIQVEYRRTEQIFEDVLEGEADLGLVAHRINEPELEFIPIRKEPLVLICHPQHPFAQKKTIRLGALKGQTFMSFEQGFPDYQTLAGILRSYHGKRMQIIEFNDIEPIKRAVAIGAGVAIVPEVTVRREVADRTLAALSIADRDFHHTLVAVRNPLKECTPVLKQFIALLKEASKPAPVKRLSSASRLSQWGRIV